MALRGQYIVPAGVNLAGLFPGASEYVSDVPYTIPSALIRVLSPSVERSNATPKFVGYIDRLQITALDDEGDAVGVLCVPVAFPFPMTVGDNVGDIVAQSYVHLKTLPEFVGMEDV
ncbi:hypothetical protein [Desulfovibrio inopinatus]|uniref:hypothetical protein n=2 Tax=Desulfovibrio inopinatus TaxID=102109 RepID=UPI0012EC01E4|nr:hypothetical protein [Desulfovibrio inopinatus]